MQVSGRVNGGTIDTGRPHCSAAVSESGATGETKKAPQLFRGSTPERASPVLPVRPVLCSCRQLREGAAASVTIRLLIRPLFNGLGTSELRRSDEGAYV